MIDEKQFLKDLRAAVRTLKCRTVLDRGCMLRFILGGGDDDKYCPITLLSAAREPAVYYNLSYEIKKAAKAAKVPALLRERINRAADRHPIRYDKELRRKLMRAAGRW